MYSDEDLRIPRDRKDLWKVLRDQFEYCYTVLWLTPVETKEDALSGRYRSKPKGDPMSCIRYRDISEGYDGREHFLEIGRELLPELDEAIHRRELTPRFVQQWGKLMFCHGYIAAYYFDDSDDLAPQRAGLVKTRDPHRKWIAERLLALRGEGYPRAKAEELIVRKVKDILKLFESDPARARSRFGRFEKSWFEAIVPHNWLASTYDDRHFSFKQMQKFLDERPELEIPPTDIELT